MLETLAQGADIKPGDQVVSSGDGGILPPGLPVGTVVADGAGFRVALLSEPATSQEVDVVDFKNPMETPPNPTAKDLPVTAAGLPPAAPPPPPTATSAAPGGPAAAGPTGTPAANPGSAIAPPKIIAKPDTTAKPKVEDDAASAGDDPGDNQ
jgi:rod shape-determining protein MreC